MQIVGKLIAVARRATTRAPMELLDTAMVSATTGVADDFRGKSRKRPVTLLSQEQWNTVCAELGEPLPWTLRRANLLVQGVTLPQTLGAIIQVGSVRLQVTDAVAPCSRMDEQFPGLTAALQPDWRGGVGCIVLEEGSVGVGDPVYRVSENEKPAVTTA